MAQQGYGPPTLPVGTEVSAKYRGAFCEAKVKTVVRIVKCKVLMKDCQTSIIVTDEEVKGSLKLGGLVEVKHPDTEQTVEATINKLIDHSTYTVVFDDGDERTLRRSQLCLKGDKHFIESETLDNLPLSHPEHFGTPVLQSKKAKRKTGDESDAEEEEEESEEESPRRAMYRGRHQELVGKLMLVDLPQRKGAAIPALVVLPDATSISEVKSRDQILVRSFKDSKFMTVTRKDLKEFSRSVAIKNEDKTMRTAFEKALLYFDTKELPVGWKKEDMLGSDIDEDDEGEEENEYASEDEPFEEKDRFVAQLYKFMDDRGTPINKGPCIGNKDLNLYKLFKIVQNIGGYNKVTKEMKWPVVYSKMGLPSLHQNPAHQIKTAYKKYLDAYETFYRKLGSTMGTLSRPGRVRHNSSRSILNFRGRDKSPRSPKPTEKMKAKEEAEASKAKAETQEKEKTDDGPDASSTTSKEDSEPSTRRTQRRDRLQAVKEKEEAKEKKEEPPKTKEKKEETPKGKKDDVSVNKSKEEVTPAAKVKREDAGKGKKEETTVKKEERKSTRKINRVEEEKEEKEEKKVIRGQKKEVKEEVPDPEESPKKRMTRRKILQLEPAKKEAEVKEEPIEEKKEPVKKQVAKETKVVERKEKEIPRTLERRDSKTTERKESVAKVVEKKETKAVAEKKTKAVEERKSVRRERRPKEPEKEEEASDGDEDESSDQDAVKSESSLAKNDCPIGSKIKVKYGKGKNQKIYAAKIVDIGKEGTHKTYLVHYAGWNIRYDEWIRADRVVSVLDRPEMEKTDKPKTPAVKVQATIASSIKRLAHRPPMIGQKVSKVFRTPKTIASKTRSTRSSSTELKAPPTKPDKRTTRRRSVVAESSDSKSEGSLSAHQDSSVEEASKIEVSDECAKGKDEEDEEETTSIDVEEEDEEEGPTEKTDLDTSVEDEEDSSPREEEKNSSVSQEVESTNMAEAEEPQKSDVKEEVESGTTQQGVKVFQDMVKKMEEMVSPENKEVEKKDAIVTDTKGAEGVSGSAESSVKPERASVRVAELKADFEEILSIALDSKKEDVEAKVESSEKVAPLNEIQPECQVDSAKEEAVSSQNIDQVTHGREEISTSAISESGVSIVPETEDESSSLDQNIPQLKKIDLELERKEWESERAKSKARRKESGKDGKKVKINEGSSFNSSSSGEIPTLEPIFITASTTNSKSSPSPYDFDETEAESQWQPEITKKWEPAPAEQISTSTENNTTSEDNQEKEKRKVKKKAKKKPISPQFVSETKADESNASIEDNTQTTPETQPADTEKKQGVRKKGRKRKELNPELKKEVMEQYEMTVNSVVESVKHSLKDNEQPESDSKPVMKKRRLKRVSESDKKETGRPAKPERKRGVRESLDTVEALNVEGSKEKTQLQSSSAADFDSLQGSSFMTDNVSANAPVAASNYSNVDSVLDNTVKRPSISESQGFAPQLQERDACHVPFENTPPTTPEYDDGEDGAAASSSQPPQNSSPHSDDLTLKADVHKDSSSSSSSISLPAASAVARVKSASESPSDNDIASTGSTDNLETGVAAPQSADSSGTEQESAISKKRKPVEDATASAAVPKKKKRVHGTRSRTARKSPKYIATESSIFTKVLDSSGSSGGTPNHSPDSPSTRLVDITKSPRPSKYNFNADLGEHLEGEARCNFLIGKLKEIKTIYMSLKAEVASIDRRRKRIRRKERESSQASPNDRDAAR